MKSKTRKAAGKASLDPLVLRFVYRKYIAGAVRLFEIGECDNPRTYDGWCDRRVCEGFWGDEALCRWTVDAMNKQNIVLCLKNSIPSVPRRGMIFVKKPLERPYFR